MRTAVLLGGLSLLGISAFAGCGSTSSEANCPSGPSKTAITAAAASASTPGEPCISPMTLATSSGAIAGTTPQGSATTQRRRLRAALDERIALEAKGDLDGVKALDDSIRSAFEQPLAIMVTDMSGLTKFTQEKGILATLAQVRRLVLLAEPLLHDRGGEWIKVDADDLLVKHTSAEALLEIARALRMRVAEHNQKDAAHTIGLSIGLGFGPVLVVEHDVWGNAINTGSKLGEDVGEAGELLATEEFVNALPPQAAKACTRVKDYAKRAKFPFWTCQ